MFKPLSIYLASRYVRSKQGNGFASFISASSTLGIALGVIVLIVGLSAMNGFEKALEKHLLSVIPHGELVAVSQPIKNWNKTVAQIEKHQHIVAAAPVIKMQGMVQKQQQLKGVEIRGVEIALEQQVSALPNYIIEGSWQDLAKENTIVIGVGVAKKLQVSVGDKVQILIASKDANAKVNQQFSSLKKRNVTIVGLFKFSGEIDQLQVYISHAQAASIFNYQQNQTQGVRVKVSDVFSAPFIVRDVAQNLDDYLYIYDWTRTQGHIFNDIQLVRMVMYIALSLVIAVASFNIVSTLIMAVNEKQGDIAILKTMGAGSPIIMLTFMLQGLVNGIIGCISGGIIGVYLASNLTEFSTSIEQFFDVKFLSGDVYPIDYLPSHVMQNDVFFTLGTALTLSLLATIYPAWRATKVEPAQVLGQL